MEEKLILNEILNIRKKMGLPLDREYKNFLIETLNPGLIMEQLERNLAMKALRKIFPTLGSTVSDDFIKDALKRRPIDIEISGVKYSINSLESLTDLASAIKKASPTAGAGETDEVLERLFNSKTNKQSTDFKTHTIDNLNWMSLKQTRAKHISNKEGYTKSTTDSNITSGKGTTVVDGDTIDVAPLVLSVASLDTAFDDLEKKYLGKNGDARNPNATDFADDWVDNNIANKTPEELESTATHLETQKLKFKTDIDNLKEIVDKNAKIKPPATEANITDEQAKSLNQKLNQIQKEGDVMFDDIISYYKTAASNKKTIEESQNLTEKSTRSIFDLKSDENDQKVVDDMVDNIVSESLGERAWYIRWFRTNQMFGGDNKFGQMFKGPLDTIVSFWTNNKRLFQRDGYGFWKREIINGESSGRYSYAEINVRMKFIVNEMQKVVKEQLTNVKGKTFKNPRNVEQRLKDLMKEMRDISSLQKFAGNLDDVINPSTGKIDPSKVSDNTRIVDIAGEVQFNELKSIADNMKAAIDRAADENVEGAKELKEFWEKTTYGGEKTNLATMTDFFSALDEASKSSKTPMLFNGSKEMFTDMLPFLKWFSGDNWSSRFKDLEGIGKGTWLLGNKAKLNVAGSEIPIGKANPFALLTKIPVLGDAISVSTGAAIAFLRTVNDMFFRDFLFGALWNQFKYGRLTSVEEMQRLMVKYGPIKQGIVLIIRELVLSTVLMTVASMFTESFRLLDRIIGTFTDAENDLPVEELLYLGIKYVGGTKQFIDQDGIAITADQLKEYLNMEMKDRMLTFFSNPLNLKKFIPVGLPTSLLNVLSVGMVEGDDPDYFRIAHDVGWFNSQIDETLVLTVKEVYRIWNRDDRSVEASEEEALQVVDDAKKRLARWKATGINYGKDRLKEINKTQDDVRNDIETKSVGKGENFPDSYYNDENLFKKVKTLITLEHEPDFTQQLAKYNTNFAEKEKEGLRLWRGWYEDHRNNVGITDSDGKFWQIIKPSMNPINWFKLVDEGKVISKYNSQLRYYVISPVDGKASNGMDLVKGNYYDLILLDTLIPKDKIEKIWDKYHEEYIVQYTQNQLNDHNSLYNSRKEVLEKRILNVENTLKEKESNGDCKTYPQTCERIKYRLDGGTFEIAFMDADGNFKTSSETYVGLRNDLKTLETWHTKFVSDANKSLSNKSSGISERYKTNNQIINKIMRNVKSQLFESKRFDEDDYKHWKDTFTFQSVDEKNPGQYKDVKLNMDDVMDRIPHYRKKYDEDDSFVRAVVDTHENVVRFMFTKDLANIREGYSAVGFAKILQQIRESRGEMEIWSVARPASGNWFLVKGDFTPKELMGMDLEKNEPSDKQPKKRENSLETLKKKELTSSNSLKNDEKSGFNELPKIVKKKLRDKFNFGWTTEDPNQDLMSYYDESEVKSVFGDDIKIYKLNANEEFFDYISQYSDSLPIKRGFCRSIQLSKNEIELTKKQKEKVRYVLNLCQNKFKDNLGLSISSR
jgi:hypothetical protein